MSHEVTDAMVRAAADAYLGEVFLPEDVNDKQDRLALKLARKVLEAALSASPTRAQAASAGEPYVTFKETGIYVDLARYLKSPEGQAALKRLGETHG